MIFKEVFCAVPIVSNPISVVESDILNTLLNDTEIIHSDNLDETLDNIQNHYDFDNTDRPIKVKITIEIEEPINE